MSSNDDDDNNNGGNKKQDREEESVSKSSSSSINNANFCLPNNSSNKRSWKQLKRKIIEKIVDDKERLAISTNQKRAPYGWVTQCLNYAQKQYDPSNMKFILSLQDVKNEEVKRRKLRQQQRLEASEETHAKAKSPPSVAVATENETLQNENETKNTRKKASANKQKRVNTADSENKESAAATSRKRKRKAQSTPAQQLQQEQQQQKVNKNLERKSHPPPPLPQQQDISNIDYTEFATTNEEKKDDGGEPGTRLPRRRRKFANGQEKPPAYIQAYERLDQVTADRAKLHKDVTTKQSLVDSLEKQLAEAKREAQDAKSKLDHFVTTTFQQAKDDVISTELTMDDQLPWIQKYKQLVEHKNKHGNIDLPSRMPSNKELDSLCIWMNHQRIRRNKVIRGECKLFKPHQIELLDKLGFDWSPQDKFDDHYANLLKFKAQTGHCIVPQKYTPDMKLANWVTFLRTEYTKYKRGDPESAFHKSITPDRVAKLNEIGFVWSVFDMKWDRIYDKLRTYKETNGDCNVPKHYSNDKDLANWVFKQREQYILYQTVETRKSRRCKLTTEKVAKMDEIGFQWNLDGIHNNNNNDRAAANPTGTTADTAAATTIATTTPPQQM